MSEEDIREKLAEVSHQIWASWMRYLYTKLEDDDLGMFISWPDYNHWARQIDTEYADLTEREKDSDREQADKILAVLRDWRENE